MNRFVLLELIKNRKFCVYSNDQLNSVYVTVKSGNAI